jgi:hypothetical protein
MVSDFFAQHTEENLECALPVDGNPHCVTKFKTFGPFGVQISCVYGDEHEGLMLGVKHFFANVLATSTAIESLDISVPFYQN